MKDNPTQFIHAYLTKEPFEKEKVRSRITISWQRAPSLNGERTLRVGLAWCSAKDQFCRRKGRLISRGRMAHPLLPSFEVTGIQFVVAKNGEKWPDVGSLLKEIQNTCLMYPQWHITPEWALDQMKDGAKITLPPRGEQNGRA